MFTLDGTKYRYYNDENCRSSWYTDEYNNGRCKSPCKKGFIERYRDENDRRIVLIRLTENGVMLVQEVKQNAAHYFSLVTEALSEEEKAFLLQIFQKSWITSLRHSRKQKKKFLHLKWKTFRLNKTYLGFIQLFTSTLVIFDIRNKGDMNDENYLVYR